MEQVPDYLDIRGFGRFEHRQPARPVVAPWRLLDDVPAKTVPDCAEAMLAALAIILQGMTVVPGRPDEIQAHTVASAVRRTFETGLEKAGEDTALQFAHRPFNARNEFLSRDYR